MRQFWKAIASEWTTLEEEICDQFEELFADTASKSLSYWDKDYGLPDECDPFANDLIAKVATVGGTSLEYYEDIATKIGWVTEMQWLKDEDAFPGVFSTLLVTIDVEASPSAFGNMVFEEIVFDEGIFGGAQTERLICTLEKIIPAHCEIQFTTI